jgi:hypothetical protein
MAILVIILVIAQTKPSPSPSPLVIVSTGHRVSKYMIAHTLHQLHVLNLDRDTLCVYCSKVCHFMYFSFDSDSYVLKTYLQIRSQA